MGVDVDNGRHLAMFVGDRKVSGDQMTAVHFELVLSL